MNSAAVGIPPALISITRGTPSFATKQASCATETVAGTDDVLTPSFMRAAFCAAVSTNGVLVAVVVVTVVVVVAIGVVEVGVTTGVVTGVMTGGVTTVTLPAPDNIKYNPIPTNKTTIIITATVPVDDLFIPVCRLDSENITRPALGRVDFDFIKFLIFLKSCLD